MMISIRTVTIAIMVVALLVLGWLWTAPRSPQSPTPPSTSAAAAPATPVISPVPAETANAAAPAQSSRATTRLRIDIGNSKPGSVAPPLRATQGESLTIDIASDRAGTLEIHGYGKRIDVAPGSVATLSFVANLAGRFPIDLHGRDGRHLEVTALEVQPR